MDGERLIACDVHGTSWPSEFTTRHGAPPVAVGGGSSIKTPLTLPRISTVLIHALSDCRTVPGNASDSACSALSRWCDRKAACVTVATPARTVWRVVRVADTVDCAPLVRGTSATATTKASATRCSTHRKPDGEAQGTRRWHVGQTEQFVAWQAQGGKTQLMPMRIGRSHAEVESPLRHGVDQRRFCDGAGYGAVMLNVSGRL